MRHPNVNIFWFLPKVLKLFFGGKSKLKKETFFVERTLPTKANFGNPDFIKRHFLLNYHHVIVIDFSAKA